MKIRGEKYALPLKNCEKQRTWALKTRKSTVADWSEAAFPIGNVPTGGACLCMCVQASACF